MDSGKRLSLREQRILAEIETTLRHDRKLDDRLRNLRLPTRFRMLAAQRRLRGAELAVLVPTTIVLSLTAAHTGKLGVIIACSCVGAITILLLASAIRSRIERRRMERFLNAGEWRRTAP